MTIVCGSASAPPSEEALWVCNGTCAPGAPPARRRSRSWSKSRCRLAVFWDSEANESASPSWAAANDAKSSPPLAPPLSTGLTSPRTLISGSAADETLAVAPLRGPNRPTSAVLSPLPPSSCWIERGLPATTSRQRSAALKQTNPQTDTGNNEGPAAHQSASRSPPPERQSLSHENALPAYGRQ